MEDYKCDYIIGSGPSARVMQISIEKFTLIGATTRLGMLSRPLRDRFGIQLQLDFYNPTDLMQIILLSSKKFNIDIEEKAARNCKTFKRYSKNCNKTLKRIIDFSVVQNLNKISTEVVESSKKYEN